MLFTSVGLQESSRSGGLSQKKCATTLGPQKDGRVISPACSDPLKAQTARTPTASDRHRRGLIRELECSGRQMAV